ncbi:multiubiquitin domain-containing protein [Homoserinibacter sp. YIM 151385]|uniref:multiubiquitin domain-containing protein n=1 Tax=Homoserinibacter sp. YIM 151385 TaxID=2985506 RepID=UPI0022F06B20|nr:multiubiquitin domain-containing protein [Homoserinibacter sp. YIM 151385]WBU37412.1 multiubiquitin domain-containing protein [Homoserinibacter sp. YIM 151385]
MDAQAEARAKKSTIHIDGDPYKIAAGPTPVSALRALRQPPVSDGKNLWLDIEDEQDQELDPTATIDLVDGMRFFTEIDAIAIRIDRVEYEVYKRKMTGAELRVVPSPDVAADRDLWRDVPDKRDVKVQDEDIVRLKDGMRFFTAPGRINPGQES